MSEKIGKLVADFMRLTEATNPDYVDSALHDESALLDHVREEHANILELLRDAGVGQEKFEEIQRSIRALENQMAEIVNQIQSARTP